MCGIAGIYHYTARPVDADSLETLRTRILHRGPDDTGSYRVDPLGLVHSRLSIQDLSPAGHQPMIDAESQSCICYNGEIYNFQDLRADLLAEGVAFKSTGDTEVLLHACIRYGVEATLPRLNGMFAFAFWDACKRELWLARDRMGIKPLYYFEQDGSLVFASEIKALLPLKHEVEPDLPVLFELLNGGTACEPYTVFAGIRALNPGSYLRLGPGTNQANQREYFSIFDHVDPATYRDYSRASLTEMTQEFARIMDASVRIHSISDAPVATLISGGIDSSLVSALTRRYCEGISLYHADVVGDHSEEVFARQVADHLGLDFVTTELTSETYLRNLVETTYFHETPSAYHPNDVPFQLVSQRAHRDGIKVFLTGEGADELFIGYGGASKHILRHRLRITAAGIPLVRSLASVIGKLYPYAEGTGVTGHLAARGFTAGWLQRARDAYAFVDSEIERIALIDSAVYQKVHLNSLLQRNDRMGMMHALESRIPVLENELHRFAMNLPARFKHPVGWRAILSGNPLTRNKIVVREAARPLVPANIIRRKKLGFPITPATYMHLDPGFFTDGFLAATLKLKQSELAEVFAAAGEDEKWNLFSIELFGRIYFLQADREDLGEQILGLRRA